MDFPALEETLEINQEINKQIWLVEQWFLELEMILLNKVNLVRKIPILVQINHSKNKNNKIQM